MTTILKSKERFLQSSISSKILNQSKKNNNIFGLLIAALLQKQNITNNLRCTFPFIPVYCLLAENLVTISQSKGNDHNSMLKMQY